jgi:hypothetical protein
MQALNTSIELFLRLRLGVAIAEKTCGRRLVRLLQ